MKNFSIVLFLLLIYSSNYAQIYFRNDRKNVFSSEANVRESASINAKAIGTLKQGAEVIVCHQSHKVDSINGVIASWIPILYKGSLRYVWVPNLATNTFLHTNKNILLVKNDSKGVSYKVFSGDSLISSGSYTDKPYEKYSYCYQIEPLSALKNNLYFKLSDSDLIYSFDGIKVQRAGRTDKENINSLHQSSRKEVKDSLGSIIHRDKVNLRSLPSKDSKIIGQLSKYTFVEEIEKLSERDTINNEENYWYKIKWKGNVGYVWGNSISSPKQHIYDNDDENISYLLAHNALFVLVKGKIVAHTLFKWDVYDETIHSFGDLGFGKGYDFVAIESMAHGCGEWGGDNYYLWNGKDLKFFCSDGGVGDGGLSEVEAYIFPSHQNGIPGKVIKTSYASEFINILPVNDCEVNYTAAIDYHLTSIMSYNGDSLVEVPSNHLLLKKMIQREFPKYRLIQYKLGDMNNDNLEDAVFQIRIDNTTKDYDGNYQTSYRTKIGIVFGATNDSLKLYKVNEHFVGEDEQWVDISLDSTGFLITCYSIKDNQSDQNAFGRKMYHFVYNPNDQKVYWESVSTIFNQGLQKQIFKTKKVLFENTWNHIENDNEDY